MKRSSATLHIFVWPFAGIYVCLGVLAAACQLEPHRSHGSNHHHGAVSHSSLCAWTCQVNQETSSTSLILSGDTALTVLAAFFYLDPSNVFRVPSYIYSRPPPR